MDTQLSFLKSIDFLSDAENIWLERIASDLEEVGIAAQQMLFAEGDPADAVFLIVEGTVRLERQGLEILRRGPGDYVGELALIDERGRSATAVAATAVRLLRWPKVLFLKAFTEGGGRPALNLCRGIVTKLREDFQSWSSLVNDLHTAGEVQRALLPGTKLLHGPYEVAAKCRQTYQVGGDFYDFRILQNGNLVLTVVDIEGHGMSAALLAAIMKSRLEEALQDSIDPTQIIQSLDQALVSDTRIQRLATCCLVIVDPQNRFVHWSSAGHLNQYLLHCNGTQDNLKSTGWPLNVSVKGERSTGRFEYDDGDTILLFTDGLPEAKDSSGKEFGASGILESLSQSSDCPPKVLLEGLLSALDQHCRNTKLNDDVTIVAARLSTNKHT